MLHFAEYESPIGRLLLCSDGKALTSLRFGGEGTYIYEDEVLTQAKWWLDAYFRREPQPVGFPLAPEGTAFQKLVWDLLREVPYGRTCTYGGLAKEAARRLGKERMSAQAVGQAVGSNPISILIPCHRCVGAKGKLTGYAWGLEKKQWLLDHEKRD